ncbi:hypothetical protein HPP92_000931 [Vanilla planifolia]|uniref:Uncharacterized protein n=1 Tax=Vanilla planifolia TaxID=51239 RepID=A0A835VGK5_VANPL|nr:hypothetical protein HPP92_000931 [Vanilla planifolia]
MHSTWWRCGWKLRRCNWAQRRLDRDDRVAQLWQCRSEQIGASRHRFEQINIGQHCWCKSKQINTGQLVPEHGQLLGS